MSIVKTEVEAALKHFKVSKPTYKVGAAYGGLSLNKVHRPMSDQSDFVTKLMVNGGSQVQEYFDFDNRIHFLSDRNATEISNHLRWDMIRYLLNFVKRYNDSKNNKLTILYRWFNGSVSSVTLDQHPQLESDLWNIYKWLANNNLAHSVVSEHTINGIKLLEVIRQRYEAKGVKV